MVFSTFLSSLKQKLSSKTVILEDSSADDFKEVLKRWSDIDVAVPAAILRPATEDDAVTIVRAAHEHSVPFVPASGGHSPWSTIDKSGFILDLGLLKSITIVPESEAVKVTGAVLMKELSTALFEASRVTTLGNGNTVGVIPYAIGGGTSFLTGVIGFACDHILEAKVITAEGKLVHASKDNEPDLLWAIKGAGQFFGVVLELTLKTYPISILGTISGEHWIGNFIFPLDRAEEVCNALKPLMTAKDYSTSGILMVLAPPPAFQPMLAVVPHFIGDPEKAPEAFKALYDLGPMVTSASTPLLPNFSDAMEYACAKGDFKRFSLAGISEFDTNSFLNVIEIFKDLLATCPDAGATGYAFEWHTRVSDLPHQDSAWSHQDVMLWMNTFSWYRDAANHNLVLDYENRVMAAMRSNQSEEEYVDYPNCERNTAVERRYGGDARLKKLISLKQKWDPRGVFTKQFLN